MARIQFGTGVIIPTLACFFAFLHQLPWSVGVVVIGVLVLLFIPENHSLGPEGRQQFLRRLGLFTMWIGVGFSIAIVMKDFLFTQNMYFPALISTLAVAHSGYSLKGVNVDGAGLL
ncbi:hypothetical protein CPHO_01530 [Corynebacterium phocae]|uniref:Uncharacterized protein n=1 Tax=Corynebacterium phocae TaxID=161895 RepID=A0A1L7D0X6_9CORY|nr:hypothetical protein [Corynebacterium phocae]APT91809.1 hypothetical protein CPHO_01530 [Corynebacterium phocae]KAA8727965.1 hypothetical protein F4V58_01060 [Corynebacterium phocae]